MLRIISKKSATKVASKAASPAAKTAKHAGKVKTGMTKVEAPEVRKSDPEMPDTLNRLDPKVDAEATTARERRAEELRRKHADEASAKAKVEPKPEAAKAEPKGKATASAKVGSAKAGARKGPNIGSVAREAILAGASNEDALKAVMKAFPDCNSNLGCMAWYRNKLRRDGLLPKAERGKKAA